jgi:putative endonuclease
VALFFLGIKAMHFVYVLQSEKTRKFYIGETADLDDRLARHNEGRVPSTKGGLPWKMIYVERFERRPDALSRERELKSWRSHRRIVDLIEQAKPG